MTQYVSFPFILILCEMSTQVKTYNKFVILILLLHQLFSETLGEITGKLQRNMNNLVFIVTVPIFTVYKSCSRQLLFVPCLKKKKHCYFIVPRNYNTCIVHPGRQHFWIVATSKQDVPGHLVIEK